MAIVSIGVRPNGEIEIMEIKRENGDEKTKFSRRTTKEAGKFAQLGKGSDRDANA